VSKPKLGGDRIVLVWDIQQGETLMEQPHDANAGDPAFSADGRYLATIHGGRALVWELSSLVSQPGESKPRQELSDQEGEGVVNLVVFSPDARRLATVSGGSERRGVRRGSSNATAGYRVKVWGIPDGSQVGKTIKCHDAIHFVRFNEDGRRIVTVSEHQARMWEVDSGDVLVSISEDNRSMHVAIPSVDGRWLATIADDTVRLWDVSNGEPLTPRLNHLFGVHHISFGQDGDLLATCAYAPPRRVTITETAARDALEVDPLTGKVVVRRTTEAATREMDVWYGQLSEVSTYFAGDFKPLELPSHVGERGIGLLSNHASFNADGCLAITRSRRTARVWDVVAGKPVTTPLRHGGAVVGASLSRDGKLALTIGTDHAVRIWRLERSGGARRRNGGKQSVSWAPETDLAILRSGCERKSWNLTPENRPAEYILRLAQVLSGSHVAESGGLEELPPDQLKELWTAIYDEHTKELIPSQGYLVGQIAWNETATTNGNGSSNPADQRPSLPPDDTSMEGGKREDDGKSSTTASVSPAELDVTVVAPLSVSVGAVVSCTVIVRNSGSVSVAKAAATAEIPGGMRPEPIGSQGMVERASDHFIADYTIDGQSIHFVDAPDFAPGTMLRYHFQIRALGSGEFPVRVMVVSKNQERPVTGEATIRVLSNESSTAVDPTPP